MRVTAWKGIMHTSMRILRRASLTIETALALPMFMMGLLTLVSVLFMDLAGQRIQASLLIYAQTLAMECADGHSVSVSDIRDGIADALPDEDVRFIAEKRDGIDVSRSLTDDPEYLQLCLSCDLVPLSDMFGSLRIPFKRECLVHIWNGYDKGFFPDDDYVYITDDSEVYHIDRDCSHIRLTVEETDADIVGDLRNSDGKRYKPCELCHASLGDGKLYITPEGDRYHNSVTCSGLKRTVRAIRKSQTGERRPCSRCGR